jgi:hypothetical protein
LYRNYLPILAFGLTYSWLWGKDRLRRLVLASGDQARTRAAVPQAPVGLTLVLAPGVPSQRQKSACGTCLGSSTSEHPGGASQRGYRRGAVDDPARALLHCDRKRTDALTLEASFGRIDPLSKS